MFCSNCGKTIPITQAPTNPKDSNESKNTIKPEKCVFCGCPIGEGSFYDCLFTSTQMPIHPNQYRKVRAARTRGSAAPVPEYTVANQAPDTNREDGRTKYVQNPQAVTDEILEARPGMAAAIEELRPENDDLPQDETAPEEASAAIDIPETISDDARSLLDALDGELTPPEEVDMEQFKVDDSTPNVQKPAGISDAVDKLLQDCEELTKKNPKKDPKKLFRIFVSNNAAEGEEPAEGETPDEEAAEAEYVEEAPAEDTEEEAVDVEEIAEETEEEAIEEEAIEEEEGDEDFEEDPDEYEDDDEVEDDDEDGPRKKRGRKAKKRFKGFGKKRRRNDDEDPTYSTEDDSGEQSNDQTPGFEDAYDPYDDEDEDEKKSGKGSSPAGIAKIIIAVVVVVAVALGGFMWYNHIRNAANQPNIQGIDADLYSRGIALLEKHATASRAKEIAAIYTGEDGTLNALMTSLNASAAEITALTPASPTEADETFLQAMNKIETNIANCITADAMAAVQKDAASQNQSSSRWGVVSNSINMLKNAASQDDLHAIINGQLIDITSANATATPLPAMNYNTLVKGDSSAAVMDLQNRLYALGYLQTSPDGTFGSKTQTAVKIFQKAAGLEVTGIADGVTLSQLYMPNAPRTDYAQSEDIIAASLITSTPEPVATPAPQTETTNH